VPAKTEKTETSGLVAEVKTGEPIAIAIKGK
jgi:antitoxin (DNA-binding transcriptional repressor) of toxin-antitoxin stability system